MIALLVLLALLVFVWLCHRVFRAVDRRIFERLIRDAPDPRAFRSHSIESFRDDMRRAFTRRSA